MYSIKIITSKYSSSGKTVCGFSAAIIRFVYYHESQVVRFTFYYSIFLLFILYYVIHSCEVLRRSTKIIEYYLNVLEKYYYDTDRIHTTQNGTNLI